MDGVDNRRHPRYPFAFSLGDAMTADLSGVDFIHASPPCQHYSIATAGTKGARARHPALIDAVRERLIEIRVPYVIENVPRAPLRNPLMLCGTMFDLTTRDTDGQMLFLRRHRLFESNVLLFAPRPCRCAEWKARGWIIGGVYGGGRSARKGATAEEWRRDARLVRRGGYTPRTEQRRALMGIDWMGTDALNEAIPPAYTEWIGAQLIRAVAERVA